MRRYLVVLLVLASTLAALAQQDRSKEADQLFAAGKRVDALPLYEQAKDNPNEMIYAEHLADCYLAKATQMDVKTQTDEISASKRWPVILPRRPLLWRQDVYIR